MGDEKTSWSDFVAKTAAMVKFRLQPIQSRICT